MAMAREASKRTRVLIAGHLPPLLGGIATFCQALINSDLADLVDLRFVQTSPEFRPGMAGGKVSWGNVANSARDIRRFIRACSQHRPDVVHICTAQGTSFVKHSVCLLFARAMGCRIVLHPHCSISRVYTGPSLWRWYCTRIFRLSSAVVALSREWLPLRQRLDGTEVHYLPNAIDIRPYEDIAARRRWDAPRPRRLLYLGYIGEAKGTFDLLEAFGTLEGGDRPIELTLIGDFLSLADAARVARLVASVADSGRICSQRPPVRGADKLAWLEWADILVFPSHYEGMPMTLLEAMAAGLPVVATTVGGIPDIVKDGVNGLLVPPGRPAELARAIEKLCRDACLREEFGRRNARAAQDFRIDRYAAKLAEIYARVVRG